MIVLSGLVTSGCQLTYYVKGAYHQSKILASRESVEKVLRRDDVPDEVKRKVRLTGKVKRFLEDELGLKKTRNYESYVELHREYVSWIVQAAPPFSIEPYLWSFPLVGKLPYKGYFSEREAEVEAEKLRTLLDLDTTVRGVSAFSTLGWLRDPLLSSMMRYQDHELVELIIHESVHATLFIESEAEFNESFATFVGLEGARLFYLNEVEGGQEMASQIEDEIHDRMVFAEFLTQSNENLATFYAGLRLSEMGFDKAKREKKLFFREIQKDFEANWKARMKTPLFREFPKRELNNAVWIGYQTYSKDLQLFHQAYRAFNVSLPKFIGLFRDFEDVDGPRDKLMIMISNGEGI